MAVLSDKVAVITGASSGIGEATARKLARSGMRVMLAARRKDRLDGLVRAIVKDGGRAEALETDVRHRHEVERLIDTAIREFGQIDVLINNAGIMPLAPMSKCRMDDWDDMIDINIKGLLYGVGCALPHMLQRGTGHIVNVSSVAGRRVFPNGAVYCATKHAVHALSEGLRGELAEQAARDGNRIRMTIIAPGRVETELADSIRDDETRAAATERFSAMQGPLTSEDTADAIIYAISAPEHVNVNEILMRPTEQIG